MLKKSWMYIIFILSFLFLFFSLLLAYYSLQQNSTTLQHLSSDQIELNYYTSKLNYDVKKNQTHILQLALLNKKASQAELEPYFIEMKKSIERLRLYIKKHPNLSKKFLATLDTLEKRIVSYKIVERSLIDAINRDDKEDIEDALIGFDSIATVFSKDTKTLMDLESENLYQELSNIEQNNTNSLKIMLLSFFVATMLILFYIYKFVRLNKKLQKQLKISQTTQKELKETQHQLMNYNDNLEEEINKKSVELYKKIYTHSISQLPNRNKLLEDLQGIYFPRMAILNIDKFQSFNDVYGEKIGNIALEKSAEFLKDEINNLPMRLYHVSGDEFVIVCTNQTGGDEIIFKKHIEIILEKYKNHIFKYQNKEFQFMMSAGISFSGKDKMLAYADMALKDAKRRNLQLSIFKDDKELEKTHKEDIECHKKLQYAINNNHIISHFQVIVPIQDDTKEPKFESLVRIIDQKENLIPPHMFLSVAKANRIYYKITQAVIKNTLEVIEKYQVPCSLNISLTDIENSKTMHELFEILNNFEYNSLLSIELLETEDFKNYDMVYNFCLKIKSFGIKISLDDFGAGYSNFSHILNLPIDFIKIDASLISNIDRDQNSKVMVETIVDLAKKLHVETIAEFVSSQKILDVVKEIGVDYAQGFHLGKPASIEEQLGEGLKRL
ncbi:EAL domain-containing protein [Sulfurimonas sp.]